MLNTTTYAARVTGRFKIDMPEPTAGPTSVLAMKNRYFPPWSNAGDCASLMPSVIWCSLPVFIEYKKTALKNDLSGREKAIHWLSGDQAAGAAGPSP